MTSDERLERYAELVVRVGANVQPDQDVVVLVPGRARPDRAGGGPRRRIVAGASRGRARYSDLHLRRAAIELGPEAEMGWAPPRDLDWIRRWDTSARP